MSNKVKQDPKLVNEESQKKRLLENPVWGRQRVWLLISPEVFAKRLIKYTPI